MISLGVNDERRLALERESIEFSLLLAVAFPAPAGTKYWSCAPWPITVNGQTYTRNRYLRKAAVPDRKEQLGPDTYALEFADPNADMRSLFVHENELRTGVRLDVSLCFRRADGEYHLTPLEVYSGRLSGAASAVNQDGAITTVVFSGQLANLRVKPRLMTDEDQRRRSATDTALAYVSAQRSLKWGAAA